MARIKKLDPSGIQSFVDEGLTNVQIGKILGVHSCTIA